MTAGRAMGCAWTVLVAGLAVAGCGDNPPIVVPGTPPPTLIEIWPNEDGRSWTYLEIEREWDLSPVVYANAGLVPAVTFDSVAAALQVQPAGANITSDTTTVLLRFNGAITFSGIDVQVLEETRTSPFLASRTSTLGYRGQKAWSTAGHGGRLPSLASRFVRGGMWRRTSEWIGIYQSSADTLLDWLYLEGQLTPGRTFELELIPGRTDLMLRGRIVRSLEVSTPAGPVSNGVEVHYLLDYGVSALTDESGALLGYGRPFTCASVLYAPGVGPVNSIERTLLYAGGSLRPGAGDGVIDLLSTTPGPPSIAAR